MKIIFASKIKEIKENPLKLENNIFERKKVL